MLCILGSSLMELLFCYTLLEMFALLEKKKKK
jgi:hypothetical protein